LVLEVSEGPVFGQRFLLDIFRISCAASWAELDRRASAAVGVDINEITTPASGKKE